MKTYTPWLIILCLVLGGLYVELRIARTLSNLVALAERQDHQLKHIASENQKRSLQRALEAAQRPASTNSVDQLELARLRNSVTMLQIRANELAEENRKLKKQVLPAEGDGEQVKRYPQYPHIADEEVERDLELVRTTIGKRGEPGTEEQIQARRAMGLKYRGLVDVNEKLSEESKNELFDYFVAMQQRIDPTLLPRLMEQLNGWKGFDGPLYVYDPHQNKVVLQYVRDRTPNWQIYSFSIDLEKGSVSHNFSWPGTPGQFAQRP
jgi:hypothetical protein